MAPPPRRASDVLPVPTLPAPVTARPPLLDGLCPPRPAAGGAVTWIAAETVVRIARGTVTRDRAPAVCRTACLLARRVVTCVRCGGADA